MKTISWNKFKQEQLNKRYKRNKGIKPVKRVKYKKNIDLNWLHKLFRGEFDK